MSFFKQCSQVKDTKQQVKNEFMKRRKKISLKNVPNFPRANFYGPETIGTHRTVEIVKKRP